MCASATRDTPITARTRPPTHRVRCEKNLSDPGQPESAPPAKIHRTMRGTSASVDEETPPMRFSSSASQPPTEISTPHKGKTTKPARPTARAAIALAIMRRCASDETQQTPRNVVFPQKVRRAQCEIGKRQRCRKSPKAQVPQKNRRPEMAPSPAPMPQEKFSRLTAAATLVEGKFVARILMEGLASP